MRWRTSLDLDPPAVRVSHKTRVAALVVLGVAVAAGALWSLLALGTVSGARARTAAGGTIEPIIEATHLPPLLTVAGDNLHALRYDITCTTPVADAGSGCDVQGTVYARPGGSGPFRPIALTADASTGSGRYAARLPARVAESAAGFTYYATIRDALSGATVTLPAGGASAPARSLRLASPITIDLGAHQFDGIRSADERVASASWGDGPNAAGIEEGPQLAPIGASSFDVDSSGTVTVLDEAHKRLLRFAKGAPTTPVTVPVDVRGTIADLAARPDGGTYVLESVAAKGETPLLESFDASGRSTGAWHAAQPTVGTLRLGPNGPQALEYPAGQWMPIAGVEGVTAATQVGNGRPGRAIGEGRELVAQREGAEARVAVVGPEGIVRSWRIHSTTPLAEIQLAEPLGDRAVVVLRTYTDTKAAFVVLVLGNQGVEQHFSVVPFEWAESAPLSRFRLVGSALYNLGSTPAGVFVDRFDLEVDS